MNNDFGKRESHEQWWARIWPKAVALVDLQPAPLDPADDPDGRSRPVPVRRSGT
jgi:hypothetical protein